MTLLPTNHIYFLDLLWGVWFEYHQSVIGLKDFFLKTNTGGIFQIQMLKVVK